MNPADTVNHNKLAFSLDFSPGDHPKWATWKQPLNYNRYCVDEMMIFPNAEPPKPWKALNDAPFVRLSMFVQMNW